MSLTQVLKNFRWRIEATTPTSTIPGRKFRWVDPSEVVADQSTGTVRAFHVRWLSSSRPDAVEDATGREADHVVEVVVFYPAEYPIERLHDVVLSDRHDLLKTLRDDRLWVGYDAAHASDDIGLFFRTFVSDERVDVSPYTVALRQVWQCRVWESE